jgi:predicted regulator of Ras-like GTPase activity (Roadblock/LC7/MglB family)
MVKKKKNIQQTVTTMLIDGENVISAVDEEPVFEELRMKLAAINKIEGITGYILRDSSDAVIDLKDQSRLVDYALLSSQAYDFGQEISELFDLGNVENIVVEGKDVKVVCINIDENKVSIFMEKTADHACVLKEITP